MRRKWKTSISLNKLFDIADVLEVPVKDLFDFRDTLTNRDSRYVCKNTDFDPLFYKKETVL